MLRSTFDSKIQNMQHAHAAQLLAKEQEAWRKEQEAWQQVEKLLPTLVKVSVRRGEFGISRIYVDFTEPLIDGLRVSANGGQHLFHELARQVAYYVERELHTINFGSLR